MKYMKVEIEINQREGSLTWLLCSCMLGIHNLGGKLGAYFGKNGDSFHIIIQLHTIF